MIDGNRDVISSVTPTTQRAEEKGGVVRDALLFVREFYAVGGNGEGWTFAHLDAIAAVLLGESTAVHRRLAQGVMGVEWVRAADDSASPVSADTAPRSVTDTQT